MCLCVEKDWNQPKMRLRSRKMKGQSVREREREREAVSVSFYSDWDEPIPFTPETRTAAHKHIADKRKEPSTKPRFYSTILKHESCLYTTLGQLTRQNE